MLSGSKVLSGFGRLLVTAVGPNSQVERGCQGWCRGNVGVGAARWLGRAVVLQYSLRAVARRTSRQVGSCSSVCKPWLRRQGAAHPRLSNLGLLTRPWLQAGQIAEMVAKGKVGASKQDSDGLK